MIDLRCKLCKQLSHCPAQDEPDSCGNFGLDLNESAELAKELAKKYEIEYFDALDIIKMGLQYGGYVDD